MVRCGIHGVGQEKNATAVNVSSYTRWSADCVYLPLETRIINNSRAEILTGTRSVARVAVTAVEEHVPEC